MSKKEKIPCRVCGKPFEPCSYCQSHTDVFRWRNFACSLECATKYINETIAYRESLKNKNEEANSKSIATEADKEPVKPRNRTNKKIVIDNVVNESENNIE